MDDRDEYGDTPLHAALVRGQNDRALSLIAAGADVNALNNFDFNALHCAVISSAPSIEVIEALFKAGVNPNAQDRRGCTPFYCAVEAGRGELANKLLFEYNCDPTIKTYKNRTIYHAVAMTKDKKELAQLISVTDKIKALENEKDIFGRSPEYYAHTENRVNTKQSFIISNFNAYLKLEGRDLEFFTPVGYCSGFTLETHFWDSLHKHDIYKEILETLVQWDRTPKGLEKKLEGSLARYQTVRKLFETFLSPLTMIQQIRKLHAGIFDEARDVQLALLGQGEEFQQIFQPMRIEAIKAINSAQLEEILEIVRHFPKNTRCELGGSGHVAAFKINDKHEFQYSDSNFETADWVTCTDAKSFVDMIIKTKYLELGKAIKRDAQGVWHINDDVRIQSYVFQREHVPITSFNYFLQGELPQTRDEVEKFIANSPSGFSHFHVVVLTNSKDNFSQLLDKDFCLEYLNKRSVAAWWKETPLDILFGNRNEGMLNILFDKMHLFSSEVQALMLSKLREAIVDASNEMSASMDTEGAQFVIRMAHHLDQADLSNFFQYIVRLNDHVLLENMLRHNVFDRLDETHFKSVLADRWVSDSTKAVVKKYMGASSDVAVEMKGKGEAQNKNIKDCREILETIKNKNPALHSLLLEAYEKNNAEGVPRVEQMKAFISDVSEAKNHREFFKVIRENGYLLTLFGDVKKEQFDAVVAINQDAKAEVKSVSTENKDETGSPRLGK